jgi:hypothetical protein
MYEILAFFLGIPKLLLYESLVMALEVFDFVLELGDHGLLVAELGEGGFLDALLRAKFLKLLLVVYTHH